MFSRRLSLLCLFLCVTGASALPLLPLPTAEDRILIIAPHPDDEVLACGGLIQQAVAVGADVRVIF